MLWFSCFNQALNSKLMFFYLQSFRFEEVVGVGVTFRKCEGINTPLIAVYVRSKDESELSKETLEELKKEQYEVTYNADMRLKIINSTGTSIDSGTTSIKMDGWRSKEWKWSQERQKETKDKWNQSEEGYCHTWMMMEITMASLVGMQLILQRNPNMDIRFEKHKQNSANSDVVQKRCQGSM